MFNFKRFWQGINIKAKTTTSADTKGDLEVIDSTGKLGYHNGATVSPVLTESHSASVTNKTVVVASNTITTAASGNLVATELNAALAELDLDIGNVFSDLGSHITDTIDAHDASAISNIPAGSIAATNVQTAINELDGDIQGHITASVGAHAGTAISNTPSGNLAATTVQAALNELQTDVDTRALDSALTAHINDTTDAHAGTAITNTPSGNLAAVTVQAALNELQGDIDTINVTSIPAKVTGPASATDEALVRYDGTTGKLVQNSVVTVTDAGLAAGLTGLTSSGTVTASGTLASTGSITESFSTDAATTGANATVSSPTTPVVRLTNASLTSIDLLASPVAGRVVTIVNATGNAVNINNDTGGTAANRILTGTKATLSLADEASIIVKYDSTESRWMVIGGTGSGGGASLDTIFQLTGGDVPLWSTGDNAAFLGGGTLSGTFVADTSTPLQGLSSYVYTQTAGSLNDYLASPSQAVNPRFRGQQCTLFFPFSYDGASNDIEVIFYDVTNSAIIPTSAFIQNSTTVGIFKTNVTIPLTCANIRIGFMTRVLNSAKIFKFDSVQLTSDTTIYSDITNEIQTSRLTPGSTFGVVNITGALTETSGVNSIYSYNSGTGVYTVLKTAVFDMSVFGLSAAAASGVLRIVVNSTTVSGSHTIDVAGRSGGCAATRLIETGGTFYFLNAANTVNSVTVLVTATASSSNIITVPDTFSTDTAPLVYAGSATYTLATLSTAPVGTFITFIYTASTTATKTQTTSAPTQTTSSMNTDGFLITPRAFAGTGTSAAPPYFAVQIGKGLKGYNTSGYTSAGKSGTKLSSDASLSTLAVVYGFMVKEYDETTGILVLDAGTLMTSAHTTHGFFDSSGNLQASGYWVVNASKNPALTGLNISAVSARGVSTGGQVFDATGSIMTLDTAKTYDTNSALVAATGVFTAPESGYYVATGAVLFASAIYVAGQAIYISGIKNGSTYSYGLIFRVAAATTQTFGCTYSDLVYLNKNDTFSLKVQNERGATAISTGAGFNYFSISKTSVG